MVRVESTVTRVCGPRAIHSIGTGLAGSCACCSLKEWVPVVGRRCSLTHASQHDVSAAIMFCHAGSQSALLHGVVLECISLGTNDCGGLDRLGPDWPLALRLMPPSTPTRTLEVPVARRCRRHRPHAHALDAWRRDCPRQPDPRASSPWAGGRGPGVGGRGLAGGWGPGAKDCPVAVVSPAVQILWPRARTGKRKR